MADDEKNKISITLLLDEIKGLKAKNEELEKRLNTVDTKVTDVTEFNRALLSKPVDTGKPDNKASKESTDKLNKFLEE